MSFAQPSFLWFLLAFITGTIILRGRARIAFYTFGSYLFYSASYPPYVILLLVSTTIDYLVGRGLERVTHRPGRTALLLASLCTNLGLLGTFKYAGFVVTNLNHLFGGLGLSFSLPVPHLILPVGISFYTFQTLSYTIDVYRGKCPVERSLLSFACYVAFFPQLVAGPIVRATEFLPQLDGHRPLREAETVRGVELVLLGLFKKTVVADNCARFVEMIFDGNGSHGGAAIWLGSLFFAVQIYGDFSGYSDVARGLAKILGLDLPVNFRWPYLASSIGDFWRRWHITLSFWLRDYLYIPLGGSKGSAARQASSLLITWFLSGLWHGAAWTFVAWGLFHGAFIGLQRLWRAAGEAIAPRTLSIPRPVAVPATFVIVLVGWVLFRANGVSQAATFIARMAGLGSTGFLDGIGDFPLVSVASLAAAATLHLATCRFEYDVDQRSLLIGMPRAVRIVLIAAVLLVIVTFAGQQRDFIYFAF
ncbi:MAG: MBOAT family protein [Gemmatimonadota bacterium]|nr:MBOAT family protein [Gemmatimonadota bacterium]MDH5198383.1 MBOAT family protein [Gemmatimonadota bacterium]